MQQQKRNRHRSPHLNVHYEDEGAFAKATVVRTTVVKRERLSYDAHAFHNAAHIPNLHILDVTPVR
jgi:hypothetical protein